MITKQKADLLNKQTNNIYETDIDLKKLNSPVGIGALILVWELPLLLGGAAIFSPCMIRCWNK